MGLSINSKRKGAKAERDFAKVCREHGYDARRGVQYSGLQGDAPDVVGLPKIHIEVKNVQKLNLRDAMAQAVRDSENSKDKPIPIVAHKKDYAEWLITMRVDDWFKLYREWECSVNGGEAVD